MLVAIIDGDDTVTAFEDASESIIEAIRRRYIHIYLGYIRLVPHRKVGRGQIWRIIIREDDDSPSGG